MFTYFKMKRLETKLKYLLYQNIVTLIVEKEDMIELAKNLYTSLKDVPIDKLKDEFVNQMSVLIHNSNKKHEDK